MRHRQEAIRRRINFDVIVVAAVYTFPAAVVVNRRLDLTGRPVVLLLLLLARLRARRYREKRRAE